jgi:pSer/pThr/pTyr-binding forkhead associated (FHA) protein
MYPIAIDRPMIVGRLSACDICIDDVTVSRRHCTITQDGDELVIRDEGSVNGSYINGAHLTTGEQRLRHRDILQIGKAAFLVEEVPEIEADAPVLVAVAAG